MKATKDLVKIYTGPEVSAGLLKLRLEESGIYTLTKNDYTGSFMGAFPFSNDLWIKDDDYQRAKPLIDDFIANQQKEAKL